VTWVVGCFWWADFVERVETWISAAVFYSPHVSTRYRPVVISLIALVAVWLCAWGGYAISQHSKMTADKIRAYVAQVDLSRLSGADRAQAIRDLADKINRLSPEERRTARLDGIWATWFQEMTEDEKATFLEATMPSGFKQMLASFEQQPEDKRHRAITNAMERLKDAREMSQSDYDKKTKPKGTNQPVISEDLQKKIAVIGLKSVYSDSSAQTKAELAPLLEEIQKNMEAGRMFRRGQ